MVRVRYWGGARDIAGVSEESAPAGPLGAVLDKLQAEHGPRMRALLDVSVILLDGARIARDADIAVEDDAVLEVLPPSAGG